MITLIDHASAAVIGAAVLMLVFTMNVQMQEAAVERTVHYISKRHAIETGVWLQEDFSNIGSGMGEIGRPGEAIRKKENHDGLTKTFTFQRMLAEKDSVVATVSYSLRLADTLRVFERAAWHRVPLYQLTRFVDGAEDGRTQPNLTNFRVVLLDETGRETTSTADARLVRVQFATATRIHEQQKYLSRNHWSTTVSLRSTSN